MQLMINLVLVIKKPFIMTVSGLIIELQNVINMYYSVINCRMHTL